MIVSVVRFRSGRSDEQVQRTFDERADRYRDVPGLVEKIYVRFRDTGEWGAVYVWSSEQALAEFRDSDLARTIPDVYDVQGAPQTELADVQLIVRARMSRQVHAMGLVDD